ncbi:arginase family protein [Acidothermaceae bacterium B102]|nr:arginase family protein [Acidothermaceae bacterium B102]
MEANYAVIGVPTSAGAHHAGQERAPAALRAHGLVERLVAAGLDVVDVGDVAGEAFRPDDAHASARNLAAVVRVAGAVADAVETQARLGRTPIVLGGDCTITLGVVAGLQRVHDDVRLAYVDGDADLVAPGRKGSGVLDATGVAHLLGIADTALARIGRTTPMLGPHQLVMLGYDAGDPASFDAAALADRPRLLHFSDGAVRTDPRGVARAALAALDRDEARVVVHFDVDAVDSGDLPLADFPHYGTGVPVETAGVVLRELFGARRLAAVVLTEVNPTHDTTGELLRRYVETLVVALVTATESRRAS